MSEPPNRDVDVGDWVKSLLKIGLAGASLVVIATLIVIFGPEGDVSDSEALVWDMGVFEQSRTQKFAQSLEHLGHSPPENYEYNGNDVYFSKRIVDEQPRQLLREYQQTFVDRGLNDQMYMDPITTPSAGQQGPSSIADMAQTLQAKQRRNRDIQLPSGLEEKRETMTGMLKGSIVPTSDNGERISMSGVTLGRDIDSGAEAMQYKKDFIQQNTSRAELDRAVEVIRSCGYQGELKSLPKFQSYSKKLRLRHKIQLTAARNADLLSNCPQWRQFARKQNVEIDRLKREEMFKGFQSIEIFRPEGSETTSVTAVWSDGAFDLNKALDRPQRGETRPETEGESPAVPACSTCTHINRFASKEDDEKYYETNMFSASAPPERVLTDYKQKLGRKGWKPTEAGRLLDRLIEKQYGNTPGASQYRSLIVEKGGQRMMIGAFPSEGDSNETQVATMLSR